MLCRIYYKYADGTLEEDTEFGLVDFDYFNIRQWRKLYTKFGLRNEKEDLPVTLCIRPVKEFIF